LLGIEGTVVIEIVVNVEIVLTPPTAVDGKVDGNYATGIITTELIDEIVTIYVDGNVLGKLEKWTTTGDDGKTEGITTTGVETITVKVEIVLTPPTAVDGKVDGNKATGTIAIEVAVEITTI